MIVRISDEKKSRVEVILYFIRSIIYVHHVSAVHLRHVERTHNL